MIRVNGYAALEARAPLKPYTFERREPGPKDVLIDIHFSGICHSDIHQARDEWGGSTFPMVPGHEIVGVVEKVGNQVKNFKVGDLAGVGCFVDSCRTCSSCKEGLEQYCDGQISFTYNGVEKDGKTPTQGGYSSKIVVDENYVLHVSKSLPLDGVAPLLCAGITTYSPLRQWGTGPGKKVGVMGLGGLGHMAVKLAAAMGAEVTVLSHSEKKRNDAKRLGASNYVLTSDKTIFETHASTFDLIINTVSAPHDLNGFLGLLKRDGTMVLVGVPDKPEALGAFPLIQKRRRLAGSLIGGIKETQEMLDFCAEKNIVSDIELISMDKVNEAYDRVVKSDVKFRFVIDVKGAKIKK